MAGVGDWLVLVVAGGGGWLLVAVGGAGGWLTTYLAASQCLAAGVWLAVGGGAGS